MPSAVCGRVVNAHGVAVSDVEPECPVWMLASDAFPCVIERSDPTIGQRENSHEHPCDPRFLCVICHQRRLRLRRWAQRPLSTR
jgi:hypothetical protein